MASELKLESETKHELARIRHFLGGDARRLRDQDLAEVLKRIVAALENVNDRLEALERRLGR